MEPALRPTSASELTPACDPEAATGCLTPTQQQQWRALVRGSQMLFAALERDLESATGLPLREYEVLVRLAEQPGHRMRMSALADELVHSRSRLTHTITRVEEKGLVSRCADSADARGVVASLTEAGEQALRDAAPAHVAAVRRRLIDRISAPELAAMASGFAKVCAAQEAPASPPPA